MHFEGKKFAQMIINVRNFISWAFIRHHCLKKRSSNRFKCLVVEEYGLEYRTLGRLTQTFAVRIEETIDKVKWCTADKMQFDHTVGYKTLSEDTRKRFIH